MTEQQPDEQRPVDRDDMTQTIAFQPIDPYSLGTGAAEADAEADDGPRPTVGERIAAFGLVRAGLAALAVVLVVLGVAWGTAAALGSSGGDSGQAAAQPPAAVTSAGHPKKTNGAKALRVTISAVAANSFTGTVGKSGKQVTVAYGDDTKFGNKARPLAPEDLKPGMVVTVLGEQSGDTITATNIGVPVKKAGGPVPTEPGTPAATDATPAG